MKLVTTTKKEQTERLRRNEQKWTKPLMDAGWTVLPSVILERQRALDLDAVDVNILLQLARHWWYSDNPPHPGKASIAECMGVHVSTVQRRIAKMEAAGYLRRQASFNDATGRQETNRYYFTGLIESATPLAQEVLAERKRQRDESVARRRRRRAKLSLATTDEETESE
jgi:DNA-binding MarR family transcriptional regulator